MTKYRYCNEVLTLLVDFVVTLLDRPIGKRDHDYMI